MFLLNSLPSTQPGRAPQNRRPYNKMSMVVAALCIIILTLWSPQSCDAFSAQQRQERTCNNLLSNSFHKVQQHTKNTIQQNRHNDHRSSPTTTTSLSVLGTGVASLLAGSVGGAIGVGVAYPLDTLKTKSQVYGQQNAQKRKEQKEEQQHQQQQQQAAIQHDDSGGGAASVPLPPPGTAGTIEHHYPIESPEEDLISLVKLILEMEGIPGFFGGVKAMMVGQALIKSVAFSANELALGILNDSSTVAAVTGTSMGVEEMNTAAAGDAAVATSFVTLLLAAAFSGFVTSFLVAPVGKKVYSCIVCSLFFALQL